MLLHTVEPYIAHSKPLLLAPAPCSGAYSPLVLPRGPSSMQEVDEQFQPPQGMDPMGTSLRDLEFEP